MINPTKILLREALLEADLGPHYEYDRYPKRIGDNDDFNSLEQGVKNEILNRLKFIESLEFKGGDRFGIWVYKTDKVIRHEPFTERDKGQYLLVIIINNRLETIYWKHKKEAEVDPIIEYDFLVKLSESDLYDPKNKPIGVDSMIRFKNRLNSKNELNLDKFKTITLTNGGRVKYFYLKNTFQTINGEPIDTVNIFNIIPDENIKLEVFKNLSDDDKFHVIDQIPPEELSKYEPLMENVKKNM